MTPATIQAILTQPQKNSGTTRPTASRPGLKVRSYIGFVKPEIEIYQIATEKAKTNPEEILFIDDNNNFIEGAKKIGWQTFLFDEENPRDSVFQLRTLLNLN